MTTSALVLLTCLSFGADPAPAAALPALQRIDFSADHPETWPRTISSLVSVRREEFEQLWAAIQPKTATRPHVVLERAVYQSAIVQDRLQGGTLTADVRRTEPRAGWLRWTPWNLALSEVRWQDGPAVFGADLEGRHWLLVDRDNQKFTANWSLLGRRIGQQTEFAIEVPPALSSTVVLRVPRGQQLTCTDPNIPLETNPPEGPWVTWRIDLGSRDKATIVMRTIPDTARPAVMAYRKQVTAEVSEDHLRFQVVFQTEVLDAPLRTLEFTLPAAVELYSVIYGAETPLRWTDVGVDGTRARRRVTLPDAVMGDLRPLRFEGILPRRPNAQTVIPQVDLVDAVFLGARHTVTLLKPLQLTALKMTGCREAAAVTPGTDGDAYQFIQFLPEALLMLDVKRPTSQLSAQVLSAVTFHAEEWTQRTEMAWSTLSGSAFRVSTRIPRGWEVTDVDAVTLAGTPDPINWDVATDADGSTLMHVEFLEAVTTESPRIVRLLTRQRRSLETLTAAWPVPRALEVASGESVLVLQGEGDYRLGLPSDPGITAVTPMTLPEGWHAFPLWNTLIRDEDRHAGVWCRTEGGDIAAAMMIEREPSPATIATQVTATVSADEVHEAYELTVAPQNQRPVDRVLAYVNEAGGEWDWRVVEPPDGTLVFDRLPVEQHSLWRLPATGELWEIRLPESTPRMWRLRGERRRTTTASVRIGLMVTPQSTHSQNTVVIRDQGAALRQWTARGLQEMANAPEDSVGGRRWEYTQSAAELSGDAATSRAATVRWLCDAKLRSTLSTAHGESDFHQLHMTLRGLQRPLILTLPTESEWLTATVNGTLIEPEIEGRLRIPVETAGEKTEIEWAYRCPSGTAGITRRREVPWPTGLDEAVWARFEWEIRAPAGSRVNGVPAGLRSADVPTPVSLRRRLFGPLARSESLPLFLPWNWEAWSTMTAPADSRTTGLVTQDGLAVPTGRIPQRFYAPAPPDVLSVDIIDLTHNQSLAWIGLVSAAFIVVLLRASGWKRRDRAVVLILVSCLAFSFLVDGAWTDITGGVIAGIVIGGLLPRRWWQAPPNVLDHSGSIPGGSTQSFVISQPLVLLLSFAVAWGACYAADPPPVPREGAATIYVPIDADGRPSRRLPFVYLTPELLKQLRARETSEAAEAPTMLIERADYKVTIGPEPRTGFSVTYRILTPSGPAAVCDLLLPSVTLSGPQSCLIDGHPAAVSALPGKRGLRVIIPASAAPVSAVNAIMVEPHEIMLDFDHPWRRNGSGGSCELPLPRTALARAEVTGLPPASTPQLDDVLGGWERSLDSRMLSIALGAADRFSLKWHDPAAAETRPVQPLRVTTAESLEVTAAAIEVRSRSTVVPQSDSLSRFVWDFPAGTHFRRLQMRPAGQTEVTTLANKTVRVEVEFYEPVHDQAILEAQYVVRHSPQLGEFVWRGIMPLVPAGAQFDRPQRIWAVSSVSDLRVQPQSVENSGLVPVAAESVRDLLTGLTTDRAPQAIYQVGTDSPVAFRWTTVAPKRRLLLWQQRGEVVGSRLRWTVEADLEATTQPPAYSHTLVVDRRLQIDQISVRERGTERRLRWTESRPSGGPQARVTVWLTDPCQELQRLTLTAHMPLSTSGAMVLPNVRCEDAELIGGRLELQSTRAIRGAWQSVRGLKPLSMADDRTDVAQKWIFEQTENEPRATIRFVQLQAAGAGRALYAVSPADAGSVRLRARWEMPSSDMLSGMQILVPRPWLLEQSPVIQGADIQNTQESETGVILTMGAVRRPAPVILELLLRAPRTDFVQREIPFPVVGHDTGYVTWIAERVPTASAALLAGLATTPPDNVPEWVQQWQSRSSESEGQDWRMAPSLDLPTHWPRIEALLDNVTRRLEWQEHRLWYRDDQSLSGATRVWLEAPVPSLTVVVPAGVSFLGADLEGNAAVLGSSSPGVWELAALNGKPFRMAVLYWASTPQMGTTWATTLDSAVPTVRGTMKQPPVTMVFPPPGYAFLANVRWSGNDWADRALLRLEVLADHLAFRSAEADAIKVATQFRELYSVTEAKLGRVVSELNRAGGTRAERWGAIVDRANQTTRRLASETAPRIPMSPEIDDLLVDDPRVNYQIGVNEGQTSTAWLIPADAGLWFYALAAAIIGYPLLRLLIRCEWSPWLASRPYAAMGMLGVVWWLCLAPSIAGLAMAAVAAVLGWSAHRDKAAVEG